ncbi:MAG TPA: hypothetical protein PKD85_02985 [Saprospiraceae bacterium]|nr:hypothetical protein [Saprospiraceae bacterium]
MRKKTLLLVGASGLTGGAVLDYVSTGQYYDTVYLLTRRSLGISNPIVKELVVDFESLSSFDFEDNIDDVIICLGTTIKKAGSKEAFERVDYGAIIHSAQWAYAHGVKCCAVVSSVGADATSSNFYLKIKGKTEDSLKSIGFQKLNIFRPGLLLGNRNEQRFGEGLAQKVFGAWTQRWPFFGKYTSVFVSQLAKSMVESLQKHPNGEHIIHFRDMKKYF